MLHTGGGEGRGGSMMRSSTSISPPGIGGNAIENSGSTRVDNSNRNIGSPALVRQLGAGHLD